MHLEAQIYRYATWEPQNPYLINQVTGLIGYLVIEHLMLDG